MDGHYGKAYIAQIGLTRQANGGGLLNRLRRVNGCIRQQFPCTKHRIFGTIFAQVQLVYAVGIARVLSKS